MLGEGAIQAFAQQKARDALAAGDGLKALEWMATLGRDRCADADLQRANYLAAMQELQTGNWAPAKIFAGEVWTIADACGLRAA